MKSFGGGKLRGVKTMGKRPVKPKAIKTTLPTLLGGRGGLLKKKGTTGASIKMNKRGILD